MFKIHSETRFEFDKLPKDLIGKLEGLLPTSDLVHLSAASKQYPPIFQSAVETRKLLHYIVRNDYNAVMAILTKNVRLICTTGRVTDPSGRTFENTSGFEYALWALNNKMWALILNCIPQNEEGNAILFQLLKQFDNVSNVGVTYRLDKALRTETFFNDINPLIEAIPKQNGWKDLLGGSNAPELSQNKAFSFFMMKKVNSVLENAKKILPQNVLDECPLNSNAATQRNLHNSRINEFFNLRAQIIEKIQSAAGVAPAPIPAL